MKFDLVIKNGDVFFQDKIKKLDIGILEGKIKAIENKIEQTSDVIDAKGLLCLPGGIDSHVHISQPFGPDIQIADDFISATKSAAAGGNTCVIPFALQQRGESIRAVVQNYNKLAEGNC